MLAVALTPFIYFFSAVRGVIVLCAADGVLFNLPLRVAAAGVVLDGYVPLWNPFIFSGMPLLGAAQGGVLLPLNWFFLIFSAPVAMNLAVLSAYAVAGSGAFLYARRAGATLAGALATGLVWQLSGFLVGQVSHLNIIQSACLLPWILWATDGYGATGRRFWGVLIAALVALQAFGGHPQSLAYSLLLGGAYSAYMALSTANSVQRRYLFSCAFIAAGLGLAAVQILPTVELMRNSVRASASYDFFTSFSLPPVFSLTFVAPYLLGGGDGTLFRAPYVGPDFYAEYAGYVGAATLMLAALAVIIKRDARTKFWSAAALICFALALGRFWPFDLYRLIYYVPVLNLFRVPARHLMEVDFALAVLAGRGITAISSSRGRARITGLTLVVGASVVALTIMAVTVWRPSEFHLGRQAPVSLLRAPELFLPVVLAAVSAWAVWRLARGRAGTALVICVIGADLMLWGYTSGWRQSPAGDDALWGEPPQVTFLREREAGTGEPYRVLSLAFPFDPNKSLDPSQLKINHYDLALQPNTYMQHGIQNAAGYDGFGLARYSRLAGDMKVWGELTDPERSLTVGREFDLLNVRYLIAERPPTDTPKAEPQAATLAAAPQKIGRYAFAEEDLGLPYLTGNARAAFSVPGVAASRVALVTNLTWSATIPDGRIVGYVRLRAEDGGDFEFPLRAGDDTAEWAHDRPDIAKSIKHGRAPIALSTEAQDKELRYEAYSYVTSFALPREAIITGGEVQVAALPEAPQLGLSVQRISLIDEREKGRTIALSREWLAGNARWRRAGEFGETLVYENTRALPRAWLATEVLTQPDEASLEMIRTGKLPAGEAWEPHRTALIDVKLEAQLTGTEDAARRAQIVRYEPNRIDVKTACAAPAVLVLSENHYPGWRATIDGHPAETLRVNYNLRGVVLPPGEHLVKFVYRPKSVLYGLLVSLAAAGALLLWWLTRWPQWVALKIFAAAKKRG